MACLTLPDTRFGQWMSKRHTTKTEPLTTELRTELLQRLAEPTTLSSNNSSVATCLLGESE